MRSIPYVSITGDDGQQRHYETNAIPLLFNRACFGWRMYLGGPNRVVSLKEVLTTSQPAEQVIAGPETEVSADKTRATTRMLETVQDGVLQRSWCIIPGDPPGTYTYDITIDGEPRGEFVFCAIEVPDQNPNTDPRDLSCPNKFNSVERARPRRPRIGRRDGWPVRVPPSSASSTAGAIGPTRHYNAILDARTPNYDRLIATCPQGLIDASESFVGLPKGQMGNSEVGHMNLGAGRVAVPELPRIDNAIEDGSLARNPILAELIATLKKSGGACHLMGLASPGGVHAHQDHLVVLANHDRRRRRAGLDPRLPRRPGHAAAQRARVPASTSQAGLKTGPADPLRHRRRPLLPDGPRQALGSRDAGLRRHGRRQGRSAQRRRRKRSTRATPPSLDDEFVQPTVIDGYAGMKDGDGLLMFNFRSDRAREILTALLDPRFDGFNRARVVKFADGRRHGRILRRAQSVPQDAVPARRSSGWAWARRCRRPASSSCASPRPRSTRTSRSSSTAARSACSTARSASSCPRPRSRPTTSSPR